VTSKSVKVYEFCVKMCGVTIVIARDRERAELLAREFYDVLRLRGPDALSVVVKECAGVFVVLVASVLWIRGENVAKQPVEVSERGVLAWNGELFNAEALNEEAVSDTNLLVDWLQKSSPTEVIARCEGPFAITYLDEKRRKLLFARNRFGQRSLLIALPQPLSGQCISHEPDHSIGEGEIDLADDVLVISSVVPDAIQQKFAWREVPVSGVFELDLSKGLSNVRLNLALCYDPLPGARLLDLDRESACREVLQLLQRSVMKRVVSLGTSCRKVRLLFSGGVDCLLLAVYLHRCLPASAELVLRNVAFGPDFESAFDRVQARRALAELISLFPERKWQMEEVNVGEQALADVIEKVKVLTFPQTSVMDVTIGSVLWFAFGGIEKDPKVVFSGIGADELFAGYARHKSRFNRAEKGLFNHSAVFCFFDEWVSNRLERFEFGAQDRD
jgi:asparagine synthetase B (glutamine-hydrolysing)